MQVHVVNLCPLFVYELQSQQSTFGKVCGLFNAGFLYEFSWPVESTMKSSLHNEKFFIQNIKSINGSAREENKEHQLTIIYEKQIC